VGADNAEGQTRRSGDADPAGRHAAHRGRFASCGWSLRELEDANRGFDLLDSAKNLGVLLGQSFVWKCGIGSGGRVDSDAFEPSADFHRARRAARAMIEVGGTFARENGASEGIFCQVPSTEQAING
jgi:hypothetical protein